jgi:uncharacterized protein
VRSLVAKALAGLTLAACVVSLGCPPVKKTVEPSSPTPVAPAPSASAAASVAPSTAPVEPSPEGNGPMPMRHPRPEDGIPGTDRLRTMKLSLGGMTLQTWVADTADSRQLGLMHVKDLPEDRGMLFVYPVTAQRAFWMENTYVPLSLAYIRSDGTIDQILDMEPLSRRTHPSKGVIRLVLEVNQGWFARHGVKVGDKIPGIEGLIGY